MNYDDTFWAVFIELSRALGDELPQPLELKARERIAERITDKLAAKPAVPSEFWVGLDQAGTH